MSERSELSEALAELIERSEKEEKRSGKRGGREWNDRVGARAQRISLIMVHSTNSGLRRIKKDCVGAAREGEAEV
jgi:hypothetical protein